MIRSARITPAHPDYHYPGGAARCTASSVTTPVVCVCPVDCTVSGLSIFASRAADALRRTGRVSQAWLPAGPAHPDERAARRFDDIGRAIDDACDLRADGTRILFARLSPDAAVAQRQIDEAGQPRTTILWERPGHHIAGVARGLRDVAGLRHVWTLNDLYTSLVSAAAPAASVRTVPVVVPGIFFEQFRMRRRRLPSTAVAVGRALPSKNMLPLAAAWADRIGPRTRVPLTIIGGDTATAPGYARELTRTAASSRWISRINLGSERDRAAFLRRASVAIFPAVSDHMPQALAEAMAAGVPIIASDIPAHRAVLADQISALLVPAGDFTAIGNSVQRILREPGLAASLTSAANNLASRWFLPAEAGLALSMALPDSPGIPAGSCHAGDMIRHPGR